NLWRHARKGRLLMGCRRDDEGCQLEVISIDGGPGMDVARCLRDGYSSGGTPGTGLGAVQRLSTDFSVFSSPDKGTVLLSRTWVPASTELAARPRARFAHAGICLAAPGETVSGDAWQVRLEAGGKAAVIVADGLGHGPVAAEAAAEALKA